MLSDLVLPILRNHVPPKSAQADAPKGHAGWAQAGLITAFLSCCVGIVYGRWANQEIGLPELKALSSVGRIEYILVSKGDPCFVKVRSQNNEQKTYLVNAEDKAALIRSACTNDVSIKVRARPL